MSVFEFTLPEIGDGIAEAEIMGWLAAEDEEVVEHQPLVEVQTDKAIVELTSPVTGQLRRHDAEVGQVVKLGEVMATFAVPDGAGGGTGESGTGTDAAPPPTSPTPETSAHPAPPSATALPSTDTSSSAVQGTKRRALAAPSVRALAREMGVDITAVRGSGPGGRVTREDVLASDHDTTDQSDRTGATVEQVEQPADSGQSMSAKMTGADSGSTRIPLRGLRRTIARRMTETLRTVPHATGMIEIDVTALQDVLGELKPVAEREGVRLTWTTFFSLATIQALQEFPQLNASLDAECEEIIQHERIHLGVATATKDGLMVPVVREADRLSLLELAVEVARVSAAARDRTATAAELSGSTFTITNYGAVGGWHGTPMINLPEIGIVGFGSVEPRPAVFEGALAIRTMVGLSHAVDHRVIDGAVNASFGAAIRRRLENPQLLLLGVNRGHG